MLLTASVNVGQTLQTGYARSAVEFALVAHLDKPGEQPSGGDPNATRKLLPS